MIANAMQVRMKSVRSMRTRASVAKCSARFLLGPWSILPAQPPLPLYVYGSSSSLPSSFSSLNFLLLPMCKQASKARIVRRQSAPISSRMNEVSPLSLPALRSFLAPSQAPKAGLFCSIALPMRL